MRLVIISDTHGRKDFDVPLGDVLIHCGDLTMAGTASQVKSVNKWLGSQPHKYKVVIAGNHDWEFQRKPRWARSFMTNATYLQDSSIEIDGVRIYGSPWQPEFYDWAFNLPRGEALAAKWARIPEGVDVLVTHGPPRGILDRNPLGEATGCEDLLAAVQRLAPPLHVFGHIHDAYGAVRVGRTLFVNACICDEEYRAVNPPVVIDLMDRQAALVSA